MIEKELEEEPMQLEKRRKPKEKLKPPIAPPSKEWKKSYNS